MKAAVIKKHILQTTLAMAFTLNGFSIAMAQKETKEYRKVEMSKEEQANQLKIENGLKVTRANTVNEIMSKVNGAGKSINVKDSAALSSSLRKAPSVVTMDEGSTTVDYAMSLYKVAEIARVAIENKTGPDAAKNEALIEFATVYGDFVSLGVNMGIDKAAQDTFNLQVAVGSFVKNLDVEDIKKHTDIMKKAVELKKSASESGPDLLKTVIAKEGLDQKEILKRLACCILGCKKA